MSERPISDKQLAFIRVLASERQLPADVTPEALVASAAQATMAQAKAIISQLLSLPKLVAAATALVSTPGGIPAGGRPNRYAGKCHNCKGTVAEQAGYFVRSATGKTLVFHITCPEAAPAAPVTPVAPAVTVNEGDLYVNDEGTVRRVYTTQNGRLAVKRLYVHGHGDGSMRFESGGMTTLRADIAAGTAHLMTQAEAAAFGEQYGVCSNCGLDINDDRSLAAGYGPVCAANHNWFYPSYEQAANILRRPVTRPSGSVVNPQPDA